MEENIVQQCEQSFYKILYHLERGGQDIVLDRTTERIWLQKKCKIYNPAVYAYIKAHPNPHIPYIQALWENSDRNELTVVEQFVQGDTLDSLLAENALSSEQKTDIALQLCDTLLFLHGARPAIIHRDIKAENIVIERDGNVILLDYNAAKQYRESETRDTILIGTEGAAAPEQYGFRQSDARTDIYGFGVLLRQMFPDNRKMLRVADRATQLDPDRRYQNAAQLRKAIQNGCGLRESETCGSGAAGISETASAPFTLPIPGFRSGNPWRMALASLLFLVILHFSMTLDVKSAASPAELWLNRVFFFCMCLSGVDLFTDWSHLYRHFPFMNSRSLLLRILGYAIALSVIILFWILLTSIFEGIMK